MIKHKYFCDVCKKLMVGYESMPQEHKDLFINVGMSVIFEKTIDEVVGERSIELVRLDLCEDCRIKVVEGYSLLAKETMENLSFME